MKKRMTRAAAKGRGLDSIDLEAKRLGGWYDYRYSGGMVVHVHPVIPQDEHADLLRGFEDSLQKMLNSHSPGVKSLKWTFTVDGRRYGASSRFDATPDTFLLTESQWKKLK